MGEYGDRAKSRLTTNRAGHDQAVRELLDRLCEASERTATLTARWADRMGQTNNVLETGDATVETDGSWGRDFRAPYATVAVSNRSDSDLKVTSSGRTTSPGDGAGAFTVPAYSFARYPIVGTSVTVYGAASSTFSYSVLTEPCAPYAAALPVPSP